MPITNAEYIRYGIDCLYYLTLVDNMPSIREHGLLSHNAAHERGLVKEDISDQAVQNRRADISAFGRSLHDYFPLYFNPQNPMLFVRREIQNDLVILCFNRELLVQDGVIFTDGNAASSPTNFFDDVSRLDELDWDCIWAEYWKDFGEDGRRKRCAEVLVPDAIPLTRIRRRRVRTSSTRARFDKLMRETRSGQRPPSVGVDPDLFF